MGFSFKDLFGRGSPKPKKEEKKTVSKDLCARMAKEWAEYRVAPLPPLPVYSGGSQMDITEMLKAMGSQGPYSSALEPEPPAVRPVGRTVMLKEVGSDEYRFIRATEIESASPHNEGSIIWTKTGDFHRTSAAPKEVVAAMQKAE
ncbi:MAG: hypothetical protein DRP83_00515 [Planctomycetota bacterium]|nr:MAG: hypothetical protein DRP83_00515 [Planctomycetota bacterium]